MRTSYIDFLVQLSVYRYIGRESLQGKEKKLREKNKEKKLKEKLDRKLVLVVV